MKMNKQEAIEILGTRKLRVGDVVEWEDCYAIIQDFVIDGGKAIVEPISGQPLKVVGTADMIPRPDILPYGKRGAKWWEARIANHRLEAIITLNGVSFILSAEADCDSGGNEACAALKELAQRMGMNIRIVG